jgi:hypothetical protein
MERIPKDLLTRLQEPDERALVFNPLGLGGRMPPEQAARFQAATIEPARLAEDVPEGIRDYWERVRPLHQHGVLEYEFFSAAADLALLAWKARSAVASSTSTTGAPPGRLGHSGVTICRVSLG